MPVTIANLWFLTHEDCPVDFHAPMFNSRQIEAEIRRANPATPWRPGGLDGDRPRGGDPCLCGATLVETVGRLSIVPQQPRPA